MGHFGSRWLKRRLEGCERIFCLLCRMLWGFPLEKRSELKTLLTIAGSEGRRADSLIPPAISLLQLVVRRCSAHGFQFPDENQASNANPNRSKPIRFGSNLLQSPPLQGFHPLQSFRNSELGVSSLRPISAKQKTSSPDAVALPAPWPENHPVASSKQADFAWVAE